MKFKIKPELVLTIGTGLASLALSVLNSKKEANDKAKFKEEIIEEVSKNLTSKD